MTRFHELPDGARLAYDDSGKGRPVVLLHGVCMSRRFFERNTGPLAERFRVINVDLRGHGDSPASEGGHTVAQYAQDVKHLLDTLELDGAVLVGWSMGTFVIWDLVRQFGSAGIAGHVNVSQGPTDLSKDGWELGIFPLEELFGALAAAQSDFRAFMDHFVPEMFKYEPTAEATGSAARRRSLRIGANAGTCILLDQSLQDYRESSSRATTCRRCWSGARTRSSSRPPTARGSRPRSPPPSSSCSRSPGTARCGRSPSASTRSSATGSRRGRRAQTNTERGMSMPTFHMPASTISKILRSPARLQSM